MHKIILALLPLTMVAACGGGGQTKVASASVPVRDVPVTSAPRPVISAKGLEAVMGKDSNALTRLFGEPRLNVQEVYGRKLQFSGKACVLDAYLYPDGKNGGEIVTHVDARRSDGAEVDRAACVNALQKR
ncbi:hypothetical protein ACFOWX_12815 [Sphingorhabdus arenilitoris]|uniref:Uncharacterized protein n=1 Tax=Sphingorhabdus arenilitoris TaxID=1490041 RepID=A0ABV8RIU5_9SPHN